MEPIKVKRISHGATLGIFSPSEPIGKNRIDRFKNGIRTLESIGFKIKIGNNALITSDYTAGTVRQRVSDIIELVKDNDVSVLIAAWGGKACNQIIQYLDYQIIATQKKAFVGFSDAGVLLNHITANTGLITFYGLNAIGKLEETSHENLEILKSTKYEQNLLGDVAKVESKVLKGGISQGKLVGGNLSTFVLGVACSSIPDSYYENSILFWEDASNPIQLIDQYLTSLANKGILGKLKGMIIGDFICEDKDAWKNTDPFDRLLDIFKDYDFPIIYAPTFGHKKLENPLIPIGAYCTLDADNFSLLLQQSITD